MARPRQPLLSKTRIIEAALRFIDEQGLDGLSMRRLAAALGVNGASLYHHFPNKAAILDGVVEWVAGQLALEAAFDEDWRALLERFARSYRTVAQRHPNVIPLLALRPVRTPVALAIYDLTIGALTTAGWAPREALRIVEALECFVLGVCLAAEVQSAPETWLKLGEAPLPHLRAALAADAAPDAFEQGLAALLDGLAHRRPCPPGSTTGC